MNRLVLLYAACAAWLLAGCHPFGDDVPKHLPRQAKGNWGKDGKTCPRLDGEYQFPATDGNGFLPAVDGMRAPEFVQWSAVRLESRSASQYLLSRAMTSEHFLAAAMHLRTLAPDRYVHWRSDTLYNGGKQRLDRTYANPDDRLKPWLTQEQSDLINVVECSAGWVTLYRATRDIRNAEGLLASEYVKVDLTPDVERGLLVRTTRCRLKHADILDTKFCAGASTSHARMAPTTWPEHWVARAAELPMPESAIAREAEVRTTVRPSPAPENYTPPAELSKLATSIFERLPDRLPSGTTLRSIAATPNGVMLVLHSPSPDHVREVTTGLLSDPDVGDVSTIVPSTAAGNASEYKLVVKPRQQ